jgi:serine/threonine protein kinase
MWRAAEWVDRNLLEVMLADGAFTESRARDVTSQLLSAVDHMHKKNVVHRDLKPENVMIASDGTIRLIDFGLSNQIDTAEVVNPNQFMWMLCFLCTLQFSFFFCFFLLSNACFFAVEFRSAPQ